MGTKELKAQCPKCGEKLSIEFDLPESEPKVVKEVDEARLAEETAKVTSRDAEIAQLKEQAMALNSREHSVDIVRAWAGQLTRDEYYQLGNALGHFDAPEAAAAEVAKVEEDKKAQLAEEKSASLAEVKKSEPAKPRDTMDILRELAAANRSKN
jgi:transcription initiation factor IIE alpha subunit